MKTSMFSAKQSAKGVAALFVIIAVVVPSASLAGTTYNVNDAFVANELSGSPHDPNGSYTYGYNVTPSDNSTISKTGLVHTGANGFFGTRPGVQGYYRNNSALVPAVLGNVTASNIMMPYSSGVVLKAGELLLHPGGLSQDSFAGPIAFADIQYDVTTAGKYSLSGLFTMIDSGKTDVHVYINGVTGFDGIVGGQGATSSFNFTTNFLAVGSKIDFLVGPSDNGIGNDSTGLFANITAVPEPASIVSVTIAAVFGLGMTTWSRRRAKTAPLA